MTKKLKLMPDYGCFPLWTADDNPDPADMSLSANTVSRLYKWAEEFDARLNWDDPASTPKPTEEESKAFEREGVELWKRLREELGAEYNVTYHSKRLRRELHDPAELEPENRLLIRV